MDGEFLNRTGIGPALNPLATAQWTPSEESIRALEEQVVDSIQESALPAAVKDAIADRRYDASRPYRQEVTVFMNKASVKQMERAMRGAARASATVTMLRRQLVLSYWTR